MPFSVYGQDNSIVYEIVIANKWKEHRTDAPVAINIGEFITSFPVLSAVVTEGDTEIPSQLDDLNNDGQPDELAFVIDIPAQSTKTLQVRLSPQKATHNYKPRVYAEMLLRNDKGKHQPITSLTVPGSSDIYNLLHHHGPAFESELVAYRIYFDRKQTVDIYGKFNKQLEIEESQFYPTDEQLARGFGDDVLRVSGSCGLGTLKGWNGNKAIHIEPVKTRTESILATGPVRTIVDVDVNNWEYQGSNLNMKQRYILYAGHRDCEIQVSFQKPLKDELFCTGVQNIKGSESYFDNKGLVACWGTDWPVNDTIKYAKETVGLAISLPERMVKHPHTDKTNFLYVIGANNETTFSYHISFTSMKETFGYKTKEEWFAHVRRWKEEINNQLQVASCKLLVK
nr:DUF4861 domain-containing protein [Bacteroides sp. 519]